MYQIQFDLLLNFIKSLPCKAYDWSINLKEVDGEYNFAIMVQNSFNQNWLA